MLYDTCHMISFVTIGIHLQ